MSKLIKTQVLNPARIYSLAESNLIVDDSDKSYVLKVRDLPLEEKPREKLIKYGPSVLSLAELLAIVFNVGSKKEEVLAMSRRILKEYGEKTVLQQKDVRKLAESLDLPLQKACQLVACFELGRRFFQEPRAGRPEFLRTAKQVFEYVQDMRNLSKECFRGIYLSQHYKLIHDEVISIGSLDANIIHPREVFKPAFEYLASAIILVHNHPSGNVAPSSMDVEVTRQLAQAGKLLGIQVLDHIIVAGNKFRSVNYDY